MIVALPQGVVDVDLSPVSETPISSQRLSARGFVGEEEQGVQSPVWLTTGRPTMGSERPYSPHPGPATALRWSGAQPSETVGLRPRSAGWEDTAAAAPLV